MTSSPRDESPARRRGNEIGARSSVRLFREAGTSTGPCDVSARDVSGAGLGSPLSASFVRLARDIERWSTSPEEGRSNAATGSDQRGQDAGASPTAIPTLVQQRICEQFAKILKEYSASNQRLADAATASRPPPQKGTCRCREAQDSGVAASVSPVQGESVVARCQEDDTRAHSDLLREQSVAPRLSCGHLPDNAEAQQRYRAKEQPPSQCTCLCICTPPCVQTCAQHARSYFCEGCGASLPRALTRADDRTRDAGARADVRADVRACVCGERPAAAATHVRCAAMHAPPPCQHVYVTHSTFPCSSDRKLDRQSMSAREQLVDALRSESTTDADRDQWAGEVWKPPLRPTNRYESGSGSHSSHGGYSAAESPPDSIPTRESAKVSMKARTFVTDTVHPTERVYPPSNELSGETALRTIVADDDGSGTSRERSPTTASEGWTTPENGSGIADVATSAEQEDRTAREATRLAAPSANAGRPGTAPAAPFPALPTNDIPPMAIGVLSAQPTTYASSTTVGTYTAEPTSLPSPPVSGFYADSVQAQGLYTASQMDAVHIDNASQPLSVSNNEPIQSAELDKLQSAGPVLTQLGSPLVQVPTGSITPTGFPSPVPSVRPRSESLSVAGPGSARQNDDFNGAIPKFSDGPSCVDIERSQPEAETDDPQVYRQRVEIVPNVPEAEDSDVEFDGSVAPPGAKLLSSEKISQNSMVTKSFKQTRRGSVAHSMKTTSVHIKKMTTSKRDSFVDGVMSPLSDVTLSPISSAASFEWHPKGGRRQKKPNKASALSSIQDS